MLTVNAWTNPSGGDWDTASNWSLGHVPASTEDAVINLPGSYTVTHSTNAADSVNSLVSDVPFTLSGGSLNVATTVQVNNTFTISGGTLQGATVLAGTGGQGLIVTPNGTLNGLTVDANLELGQAVNAGVTIYNGLTLNGTMYIGNATAAVYGNVFFGNSSNAAGSLTGSGTVIFGDYGGNAIYNASNQTGAAGTLTIGPNITIDGESGSIEDAPGDSAGNIVNQGTVDANTPGGTITVGNGAGTVSNNGAMEATGGGSLTIANLQNAAGQTVSAGSSGVLTLNGNWSNSGTITMSGSTVNLGGTFTLAQLGTFTRSGGTVNLTGILNNSGTTLTLNATTGVWNLLGGTINGGTISDGTVSGGGAMLAFTNRGTLNGVTVNGDMDLSQVTTALTIYNGLVLNGTMYIGNATTTAYANVYFGNSSNAACSLTGSGTVVFGDYGANAIYNASNQTGAAGTLTIGPNITVEGDYGSFALAPGDSTGGFVTQGIVDANTSGGTIIVALNGIVSNTGTMEATGGTLNVGASWSNAGIIAITGGTLNLGGNFTTAGIGTLNRSGGTVNLTGTLNNTGTTLTLNATTGVWNLLGGTINGGAISDGTVSGGGAMLAFTSNGATLSGVTVDGDLELGQAINTGVTIYNGLVLNGTMYIGNATAAVYGNVFFGNPSNAAGSLTGSGTLIFGDYGGNAIYNASNQTGAAGTLTIGPNITIDGESGSIVVAPGDGAGSIVNQGTIDANTPGGTITLSNGAVTNAGTMEATGGTLSVPNLTGNIGTATVSGTGSVLSLGGSGYVNNLGLAAPAGTTLSLSGTWSNAVGESITATGATLNLGSQSGTSAWNNAGTISATNSTVNLAGPFTVANLGAYTATNSIIYLKGTLNNQGTTLALTNSTGSWYIESGGTIVGGTVTTTGSAELIPFQQDNTITLNGITLAGTLDLTTPNVLGCEIINGLTLDQGLIKLAGNTFLEFVGTQTLGGAGVVSFGGGGELYVPASGDVLTIAPGITVQGNSGNIGTSGNGKFNIQGTIQANGGGNVSVQNTSNFAAGTLTGGSWQAIDNSTLRLIGNNIITNAAAIVLDGAASHIYSGGSGTTNALAGFVTNAAGGTFTIQNGANFASSQAFSNAGTLTINSGSTFSVGGTGIYTQSAGATDLNSGALGATGNQIDIQGGTLSGPGTITGNLTNAAEVDLGSSTGTLAVNGNYVQTAAGALAIKVGGATAGSLFDQVSITGSATLNGTLNATLINGFAPALEETFDAINFANSTGSFAAFNSALIGGAPAFVTSSTSTSLSLVGATVSPDLAVSAITFTPAGGSIGQNITVNYSIENLGTVGTTAGTWTDSVYLSATGVIAAGATLLGRVTHTGNVSGLSSYSGTLTAPLPGLLQGNYYVIVVADSGMVVPDVNRANNVLAATTPLSIGSPLLTVGTPVSGTIANGQEIYYQLNVTPGSNVQLEATFAAADESELLVRYGALPTTGSFDESNTANLTELQPQLVLPSGQGGTYYILLDGREGASAGELFTLLASAIPFEVSSFSTPSGNNTGPVSMTIMGSGFTNVTVLSLVDGGTTIDAQSTTFINANQVDVTFDLTGQAAGNYSVKAVNGSQSALAPGTFQVTAEAADSNISVSLAAASSFIPQEMQPVLLSVAVRNSGNTNVQIPEYELIGTNVLGENTYINGTLAEVITFGGGTLAPGQSASPSGTSAYTGEGSYVPFYPSSFTPGTVSTWTIQAVPPSTSIDWASLAASPPFGVPAAAWNAIVANLSAAIGANVTDLTNTYQADAIYLAQVGESVTNQQALFGFEVTKAEDGQPVSTLTSATDSTTPEPGLPLTFERSFSPSLVSRYTLGGLGYGWTSNWNITASTDPSTGNVYIQQGAVTREFVEESNGTYVGADGDQGVLTLSQGSYTLREIDGSLTNFLPDGQFNYIEDDAGNRITAGYTDGLLTSVTATDGDQMTFTYNARNLINTVTNSAGQVTTYTYDANSELTGISNNTGTYQYSYVNSPSIETAHDLTSITYPNGSHNYFSYDSQGRLIEQSADNGAGAITYAYLTPGGYTSTNAAEQTTTTLYDVNGQPAVVKDPLGNVTQVTYNANGQTVQIALSGGLSTSTTYGTDGRVTTSVDPLGNTTQYTYSPQTGDITSLENPDGNTTSFAYNVQDELTAITQPDGSATGYLYNAQGQVSESIDALGRVTHYTYDSKGRLIQRLNPDGSYVDNGYDSQGNLISVTDASGTITMVYNSANNLSRITYPNGQYLQYSYAAGGVLTQVVDQTGFTQNYTYNSAGQLTEVTNAAGQLIVGYLYDLVGRLSSQINGNGTYSTYAYDADGNLLHLINYSPSSTINSRFDYTYNALNEATSETTLTGTTTYGYDADGQLISVALPTGEKITYAYDADGNRTVVSDTNAATADYTTNNQNQYTSVGGYTYSYDANGNLVVSGGPAGNTTYTYDTQGRLIEEQTPTDTYTYQYDALGDLSSSTDNGQVTQYLVNPLGVGSVTAEFNGSGTLIANFAYGLGLVSQIPNAGTGEYYDFDGTGSTAGISGASGAYIASYSYLPFGQIESSSGTVNNPFQYNGKLGVMAIGGGLDYMRSRFYSPTLGRFINPDPSGLLGGSNLYAFAGNNPVSAVDPTGLTWYQLLTPQQQILVQNYVNDLQQNFISECAQQGIEASEEDVAEIGNVEQTAQALLNDPDGPAFDAGQAMHDFVAGDTVVASLETDATIVDGQLPDALAPTLVAGGGVVIVVSTTPTLAGLGSVAALVGGAILDVIPPVALVAVAGALIYEINGLYNDLNVPITTSADVLGRTTTTVIGPMDPNYIAGPGGFGTQGFLQAGTALPYTVGFENKANSTAPAHVVEVTEQIDPNLDWSTFQLGAFGFDGQLFTVPAGLTSYTTQINDVSTLGVDVDVDVDADFDELNGELTWTFTTIDPTTLDDPVGSPYEGFLSPNVTPPQGQGFIIYSVQPKSSDTTGTLIDAQATVVFDAGLLDQSSLETSSISNTIDSGPPVSTVGPLPPTESTPNFTVTWSGQDDAGGSGIADYDIYASTDGGPFVPWLIDTTLTSAVYAGTMDNYYRFYSVATDNVGNVQSMPLNPQATTSLGDIFTGQDSMSFNDPNNWDIGAVPTAAETAFINSGTVVVNSNITVGNLVVTGGTLDWTGGALSSNVTIDSGATLQISGSGPMTIAGTTLTNAGTIIQTTSAATSIQSSLTNTGLLEINNGTLNLVSNIAGNGALGIGTSSTTADIQLGTGSGFSYLSALTISPGSQLDITNNILLLNYGLPANDPVATIRGYLTAGYNKDTWTGSGIASSTAAANPGLYAIGYADGNSDVGTPAAANQIYIKFTIAGDASLGGSVVNFPDLLPVAQHYGKSGQDWVDGDFNYDGIVNFVDLLVVAQNYGKQLGAAGAVQPVILTAPIEYIRLNKDGVHADIWNNATASGTPVQSILLSDMSSMTYAGPAGGDQLILDLSNGNPLPASGLTFTGGTGVNTLEVIGTTGSDTATVNGSTIIVTTPLGTSTVAYTAANTIIFNGDGSGADTLTQAAQPGGGANLVFDQPTSQDTLNVNGGTFTIPANTPGGGPLAYTLGTVSIGAGAKLMLAPSDVPADQTILAVNNLSIAGTLDLTDNVVEVDYTAGNDPITTIQGYLKSGYNNGTWTGTGITSSNAAANPTLYAVGYADGNIDTGTPAAANQIYIKNTVAGDANLDGIVNFPDLLAVAQNYGKTGQDWAQGDFNYAGIVNFPDLLLAAQNYGKQLSAGQSEQLPSSFTAQAGPGLTATTTSPIAQSTAATAISSVLVVPLSAPAVSKTITPSLAETLITAPAIMPTPVSKEIANNSAYLSASLPDIGNDLPKPKSKRNRPAPEMDSATNSAQSKFAFPVAPLNVPSESQIINDVVGNIWNGLSPFTDDLLFSDTSV